MDTHNAPAGDDNQQRRADHIVAMARRHAEEIRTAAEREADQLIRAAENRVTVLQQEHLAVRQQELERLAAQCREIENCLTPVASAVARMRELITVPDVVDPLPASTEAQTAEQSHQHRITQRITIVACAVLGVWFVTMVPALRFWSNRSTPHVSASAPIGESSDAEPKPLHATATHGQPVSLPTSSLARTAGVPAAASNAADLTVVFTAARECWISVAVDEGASTDRLLRASETHVVRAHEVVAFRAGNAAALSVTINDQQAPVLGTEGEVVTRRITRENYRQLASS